MYPHPASSRRASANQPSIHAARLYHSSADVDLRERDEETVCASPRNLCDRGGGFALRGTGSRRQARAEPRPIEHPPDGLRARWDRVRRQFATQKMRFAENGYPDDYVRVFEYDSSFSVESQADVQRRLDELHRPGKAADGPKPGRSPGPLARHRRLGPSSTALPRSREVAHYVNTGHRRPRRRAASRPWPSGRAGGRRVARSEGRPTSRSPTRRTYSRRPHRILRRDVQVLHRPGARYD